MSKVNVAPAGVAAGADSALTVFRVGDPAMALGLAVAYLMTMPAFARLPFGRWSGVLVGAVNRGHCLFVGKGDAVVAFAGWALASAEAAETWLAGRSDPATESGREGDCIIINAWAASSPEANQALLRAMRVAGRNKTIYAKREYADGHSRPLKLSARPPAFG
jgi:hemolysin-activating ACP:hemolysin acyltransferase